MAGTGFGEALAQFPACCFWVLPEIHGLISTLPLLYYTAGVQSQYFPEGEPANMKSYQKAFIEVAMESQALRFGEFALKSGRISPYFFNAGLLYQGKALSVMAEAYARTILDQKLVFDLVFGPAYKGIALAALTASALYEKCGLDVPFAYNRKEKKTHGEGGQLVGAPLQGKRVLVVDDVITAGTAVREVVEMLQAEGALFSGVIVGLDRQERGQSPLSAIQEIRQEFGVPVASIIRLEDIVAHLEEARLEGQRESLRSYQKQYGVMA
jgi:orotate phosphoribosyltransferase